MLEVLTQQLTEGRSLSDDQIVVAVAALTNEAIAAEPKADFLAALARKGETPEEIASFVRNLREKSLVPPLDPETRQGEILDVCGTGGDRLNTFNISTTVALVAAAAGITVAKHGNRAITSQSGSADVLEALGVRIDLPPEEAAAWLRERRFAFFFAQRYHPAFRHIAAARKLCAERGQRTIFNFLGPLLNPARPSAQLVGVARPDLCAPVARVLQAIGVRRGMVVCGRVPSSESRQAKESSPSAGLTEFLHLDELSTLGESDVAEFYHERALAESTLSPASFPLQPATLDDLAGGDRETNARIILSILEGRERGPKRDAVLFNAGAALFVAGRVRSQIEGFTLAGELLDSGAGMRKLSELRR